ncbi:hypothetical protein [Paenibacillus sp. YPG26]|uniref:SunI/YnzG family protein n=1 Tax=Paenibacillus sp. YPG26 TaxID=2878915 RepID=UPI00203C45D7|nr:hypothetical protein [Paenibacillus sp. YPG26]USB31768.1 hypothetical protein LDO05_10435 [Paenibacillus sp. YPG26]
MLGINVTRNDFNLIIHWQMSSTEIPLSDIKEVYEDDTYAGEGADAVRIGTPYNTTDRIVINTSTKSYILFTTNSGTLLNKIKSYTESQDTQSH